MSNKQPLDLSKLSKRDFPFKDKLSHEQEDMVIKLFNKRRVIVDSISGAGKTVVLTQAMKALLDKGYISRIYYVVFPVQEDSLGYLPGGVADKVTEYAVPFVEALIDAGVHPHSLDIKKMCDTLNGGEYIVVPHTYLRGRTIGDAGVIIDEAQNGEVEELKKTLTRLDDDCYVGIAGHVGQTDISNSGFSAYLHHFKQGIESGKFDGIEVASLSHNFRGDFARYCDELIV